MQRSTLMAALAALGFAAGANAASDKLENLVTQRDGWVAYRVPQYAGDDGPCCYSVHGGAETKKGCELDQRSWSVNPSVAGDDTLAVYLKVERGRIERIRSVAASCPVHTASPVRWIEAVEPADSVAMLSSLLDR